MDVSDDDIQLSDEEEAAGFSVQTLTYPENYELPDLAGPGRRLERAVALVIDADSRIRRRQVGTGYVLEVSDGEEWSVAEEFETIDDAVASDLYGRWKVETSSIDDEADGVEPEDEL